MSDKGRLCCPTECTCAHHMSQDENMSTMQIALNSHFHSNWFHNIAASGWHGPEEISVKKLKSHSKHKPKQIAPHVITQNGRGKFENVR
jgi:hypothetical protein